MEQHKGSIAPGRFIPFLCVGEKADAVGPLTSAGRGAIINSNIKEGGERYLMAIQFVLGDLFILFERVVHGFAYGFSLVRGIYALLPVKCSGFGHKQDNSVHFSRCDCLLPLNVPA